MRALVIVLGLLAAYGAGILFYRNINTNTSSETEQRQLKTQTETDITASFTIITDSITRNFSNPKYHNKSEKVFIATDNPSLIYIKKAGVRWSDFFATLPMKLTKECLITGDGETLCNKEQGTLEFFLNDKEDKDVLDKVIKQNDKLLVRFTSN